MILYRNAERVISPEQFSINHLGYGVFETLLIKYNSDNKPKILSLDLHIKRLIDGCKTLKLNHIESERYKELLDQAMLKLDAEPEDSFRVRIVIFENDWFLQIEPFQRENKKILLKSTIIERNLPHIKSCSAIACIYSQKLAAEDGFDEALLIDNQGIIRETSWANFFWFDTNGRLFTAKDKVLPGVTREIVLEIASKKYEIQIGDYNFASTDISAAFTCRSTNGINEVIQIDNNELTSGHEGYNYIREAYENLYK